MLLLGRPALSQPYARNIWDMQVFNSLLYIGCGNSSNNPPAANAGPIDVLCYDPKNAALKTVCTVNEEQIDIFRVINGVLFIPGHDSKESWEFGNYYTYDGSWNKHRTIPKGVHVYDIAGYNGKLYAATGTDGFSPVVVSADNGSTWNKVTPDDGSMFIVSGGRAYTLFEFKGILYASSILVNLSSSNNNLLAISGSKVSVQKVTGQRMLPGLPGIMICKLVRPTVFNGKLLYIAGKLNNDHQYIPLAMYALENIGYASKITFPVSAALPYDILVRGLNVYVLSSVKISDSIFLNIVYTSTDLVVWKKVIDFNSDTFARSFEELNGDFYFGLGCDTVYMPESSGSILKISSDELKDVTGSLEFIGNPLDKEPYANNVWDMQLFGDSIYIGHGNSSNYLSATNAGPIDIISYDTAQSRFNKEYTVNENQVDIFRFINNRLIVPGHESRDGTDSGSIYALDGIEGIWTKAFTLPKAKNIFDIAEYNGNLYAAVKAPGVGPVFCSKAGGQPWEPVSTNDGSVYKTSDETAYSMFEYKGSLYTAGLLTNARNSSINNILRVTGDEVTSVKIYGTNMFPGLPYYTFIKLVRTTVFNNKLLFIAGKVVNEFQYEPLGLYSSANIGYSEKIGLGEPAAVPYDIIVRDSSVYVLASVMVSGNKYRNIVYSSHDLSEWNTVFTFWYETFARSFEEHDGNFYFGIGCNTSFMPQSTGNIIKVKSTDVGHCTYN